MIDSSIQYRLHDIVSPNTIDGHCFRFPSYHQPFIVRELSQDTDLALYNNMIEIQHNPKFAKFFKQL